MNGFVIWITGLPGSGKSTIADGIKGHIPDFVILRIDELREIITPEPTYSESEREMVYRTIVYMAKILSGHGHNVIIDATGNMRRWRELARELIPNFAEVYLECSINVCREREASRKYTHGAPEGIYKKGEAGWPVPGVQAPYERPLKPEISIQTDKTTLKDILAIIGEFVSKRLRH
ncbi:adenylyl-sulfate kinase [Thermodesulfovibrionales bacterium]|nr:adenylyl-sulfate kinase [Thermodesulfovibrionales bacterium]